jgi:hypothetical protein
MDEQIKAFQDFLVEFAQAEIEWISLRKLISSKIYKWGEQCRDVDSESERKTHVIISAAAILNRMKLCVRCGREVTRGMWDIDQSRSLYQGEHSITRSPINHVHNITSKLVVYEEESISTRVLLGGPNSEFLAGTVEAKVVAFTNFSFAKSIETLNNKLAFEEKIAHALLNED